MITDCWCVLFMFMHMIFVLYSVLNVINHIYSLIFCFIFSVCVWQTEWPPKHVWHFSRTCNDDSIAEIASATLINATESLLHLQIDSTFLHIYISCLTYDCRYVVAISRWMHIFSRFNYALRFLNWLGLHHWLHRSKQCLPRSSTYSAITSITWYPQQIVKIRQYIHFLLV